MPNIHSSGESRHDVAGVLLFKQWLRTTSKAVLDIVFPPRCAACGRVDERWCNRCNKTLNTQLIDLVLRKEGEVHIASTGAHAGLLQRAVQALKYEQVTTVQDALGERLRASLTQLQWPVDVIIPVPLHPSRLQSRGYNQAQLLAESAAKTTRFPCYSTSIQRTKNTQSQVGLNEAERQRNVQQAFIADTTHLNGKTILLIDDVCTTGATLVACAQAALAAGATAVFGLTVTTA